MDPLFYDDLEYGSSLLQSPMAKNDLYATLNGKMNGKTRDEKERNGNGNGRNGHCEMRSILKNGNHIKYNSYCAPTAVQYQCSQKPNCFNRIIRPCAAEFIAVFLCIFVGKVMENELAVRVIMSSTERIILQALTDSVVMLAVVSAFQTVHLNPVITLAEFFALTTAWPMCCAMIIMQMLASVAAIAAFAALRSGDSELQMPTIISDITVDRLGAAYHLVLSQFIGTLLVVITHLLITARTGFGLTALSRPGDTPVCVAAAVFVSSLLCLLNSTVGWNPLLAFALASYGSIDCHLGPLQMQGIFWIGPCLASLFACFMYRLLFATKESRLIQCTAWSESDNL
uniref:G_PROTEIN_RECEP_F1_2 domain-containing protein n=1 Tax=Elaeophora elaphi TaxID=1147741 RepID=A0A0R3RSN9_9BILA